jgi:uncharacterized protein
MESSLIPRKEYLARIEPFVGKPVIKVLTGMRRVGKSSLLKLLARSLGEGGPGGAPILFYDMESLEHEGLRAYRPFYDEIKARSGGRKVALLVDEVQEIEGWEKALSSLLAEDAADMYVAGSNAALLSGELATFLAGRAIEIPVWPLSLPEFADFRRAAGAAPAPDEDLFRDYLRYGGLPGLHALGLAEPATGQFLQAIYSAIVLKDVLARTGARDAALLERVASFAFDNIGSILSSKRVADFLRSDRRGTSVDTVASYLRALEDAFLLFEVGRFDVKGKRRLALLEKYYAGDVGLRQAVVGYREGDVSGILENLVYLELRRRGYHAMIGKAGEIEIDFVAERGGERAYVQVAYLLESKATVERELAPFAALDDKYPCYLVTLDRHFGADLGGVARLNLVDFLLGAELKNA